MHRIAARVTRTGLTRFRSDRGRWRRAAARLRESRTGNRMRIEHAAAYVTYACRINGWARTEGLVGGKRRAAGLVNVRMLSPVRCLWWFWGGMHLSPLRIRVSYEVCYCVFSWILPQIQYYKILTTNYYRKYRQFCFVCFKPNCICFSILIISVIWDQLYIHNIHENRIAINWCKMGNCWSLDLQNNFVHIL